MTRHNKKYLDVAELLLAKRREEERLTKRRMEQTHDTLAWILAFCVAITMVIILVSIQEGWW